MIRSALVRRLVLPALILAWACALRVVLFSGFVLCDDREEFWTAVHMLVHGPAPPHHLQLRFGAWLFNVGAFKLFGISEFSFFVPTALMSASLSVVGYAILLRWGYALLPAFAAALMIAAAPFEILMGTVRANDMILAWLVGLAVAALVVLDERPVRQGLAVALLGWLGFYVKLWVVYFLPALGIHCLVEAWRRGRWRGGVVFALASLVLHGATCAFWKRRTGYWLPFIWYHAATYPVKPGDLARVLRIYPDQLLHGSEFGTTLFGSVPYLLALGLALKLIGTVARRAGVGYRMDARDWALFGSYASFALLLEFFPNSFTFDRYYSAPRIFRYQAPLSFPMTLHLAKMVLDLVPARAGWLPVAGLLALTGLNLHQAAEATAPSRAYRATLMAVLREVRARRPPMLVTEGWLSYFLSNVYLNDLAREVQVVQIPQIYAARDYEAWLQRRQPDFAPGTFLLTGFGSCVHYGAIGDGFRLALFQDGLHPAWKVLNDYGPLAYHPSPEPVRLWELTEPIARTHPPPADGVERSRGPEQLFKTGMARFDEGKPAEAAPYFHTVATDFPDSAFAEDAEYFYAICLFREGRWWETIVGFEEIVRRRPAGRRVPAAYYHIGLSYAALGDQDRAREAFETLRRRFPREETLGRYAAEQLAMLDAQAGWFERLRKRLGIRR
ncbi:MAG: tetratricopeptide repeat protein [Deltaproteobacteria bacterium]|nr:MAG: tetratricopeptide repeat protein [Deltaproteobacteria bacterium]